MSIIPPPRAAQRLDAVDVARPGGRASICSRVAAGDRRTSQPSQSRSLSARSIATIRRGVLRMRPGVVLQRRRDGETGPARPSGYGTRAGARRTGDQQRPRGRRRRRRRALRGAAAPPRAGARGRARLRDPAGADGELLGAGRDRRGARRRGLPRAATSPTPRPPAATLVRRSAAQVLVREAPARVARPRARSACASTPTAAACLALGLEGGHSRAPRRARRRQRDRPARRAPALGARRRRAAHRGARGRARRERLDARRPLRRRRARGRPRDPRPRDDPRDRRRRGAVVAHDEPAGLARASGCRSPTPPAPSSPTSSSSSSTRPRSSASRGREGFLVTEAIRGEGATLHGPDGERFVEELAPRDEVARAIAALLRATGATSVGLDMRAVDPALFPERRRGAAGGRPGPDDASRSRSPPPRTT